MVEPESASQYCNGNAYLVDRCQHLLVEHLLEVSLEVSLVDGLVTAVERTVRCSHYERQLPAIPPSVNLSRASPPTSLEVARLPCRSMDQKLLHICNEIKISMGL